MRSTFLVSRGLRTQIVIRTGLVFDTRFAAPGSPLLDAALQIVLSGDIEVMGPFPERWIGPVAWLTTEAAFEGTRDQRRHAFRAGGSPYVGIHLRCAIDDVSMPVGDQPRRIPLDDETIRLARAVIPPEGAPAEAAVSPFHALLAKLVADGVLRPGLEERQLPLERIWTALAPLAQRFNALPTLQEVSRFSGRSLRQVARDVSELARAGGAVEGWRETMRRFRLKLAVTALSSKESSVSDVAHAVGYGSVDAMSRAFRDAGLPSPSEVRARIHGPADPYEFLA